MVDTAIEIVKEIYKCESIGEMKEWIKFDMPGNLALSASDEL